MLLRITLNPSFDEQQYKEAGIGGVIDIFAEVSSAAVTKSSKKFVLKECPLDILAHDEFPTRSMVVIHKDAEQSLLCWWNSKNCKGFITLPVQVRKFPSLPNIND